MHCVDKNVPERRSDANSPTQFMNSIDAGLAVDFQFSKYGKICIFAFGQTEVPAKAISDYADEASSIILPVVTDGRVPGWLSAGDFAIVVSCGLNRNMEMITCSELSSRGCSIVCMAPGNALVDMPRSDSVRFIQMPCDASLSEVYGFVLGALSRVMQTLGVMRSADELVSIIQAMGHRIDWFNVRFLAKSFGGKIQAFYSTSDVHALSLAWKEIFSDCGIKFCFAGELPEFDHNELVGWSDPNAHAPDLQMVVLRGCSSKGLVFDIVGCMQDVLRENGRSVLSIDIGDGGSMQRNVNGILLAFAVHDVVSEGE